MQHLRIDRRRILWQPAAWLQVFGIRTLLFFCRGSSPTIYGYWKNQPAVLQPVALNEKVAGLLANSFVLRAEGNAFWVGSYFSPAEVLLAMAGGSGPIWSLTMPRLKIVRRGAAA